MTFYHFTTVVLTALERLEKSQETARVPPNYTLDEWERKFHGTLSWACHQEKLHGQKRGDGPQSRD